jgi:hypothetical protein
MGENYGKLFFANTLGEELPIKWKSGTTAPVNNTLRAAGRNLQRTMTSIRVFS